MEIDLIFSCLFYNILLHLFCFQLCLIFLFQRHDQCKPEKNKFHGSVCECMCICEEREGEREREREGILDLTQVSRYCRFTRLIFEIFFCSKSQLFIDQYASITYVTSFTARQKGFRNNNGSYKNTFNNPKQPIPHKSP